MVDVWFWLAAGGMALAVAATLIRALLRPPGGAAPAAAFDLQVYRDQLREVDKDVARGLVPEAEAERLRTEIARRVLEADRALQAATAAVGDAATPRLARGIGAAAVLAALLLGGGAAYLWLGAPGYPDLPLAARIAEADARLAARPSQAEAETTAVLPPPPILDAETERLLNRLREVTAERPNDLQGQEFLARLESAAGNYAAAHRAKAQVIALKGPVATTTDYTELAVLMIQAAGGQISPEAEEALRAALQRDPDNGLALFFAGMLFAEHGRHDRAFELWRRAVAGARGDEPWLADARTFVVEAAARAGEQRYELPPLPSASAPARGPTAADIEAAGEMSEEDRAAMVRGMVEGLSARLASEGGTAEDWSRLIRALGVLGETERARAIWQEAAQVFAAREGDLAMVRAAAEAAGVAD